MEARVLDYLPNRFLAILNPIFHLVWLEHSTFQGLEFTQPMEDKFVQVGQVRTRYRTLGDQGSTVILLHGIARSLEDWSENMRALSSLHRVFALDLVGFGLSDKPDLPYSVPFLAGFVRQFMQTLGLEPAVLMGNSMGGAVALELAFSNPELVEALVLAAPAGIGSKGAKWLAWCWCQLLVN